MEAVLIRKIMTDEWVTRVDSLTARWLRRVLPLTWILPPHPRRGIEFQSYVLFYRLEATPRELAIIRQDEMFGHIALVLRSGDAPITLADALGPNFIPESNRSTIELLRAESVVREAAAIWTQFMESVPDPKVGEDSAPVL